MQAAIDAALREEQSEWQATTGRPMPMNLDEMVIEARVAGFTAAEAEAGDFKFEAIKRQATAEKILRAQRLDDEARTRPAMPVATAKTTDKPKASAGAEYDVDAMLIETINKTAKRDCENNKEKADEMLSQLGWTALAEAITEATARPINERTLRRHAKPGRGQSNILKRWKPRRPERKRGGKSAAKQDRSAAVDVAGAPGQLSTVSRAEQKVVQRPDLSQDRRTDRQRQHDEAEARWIVEGRRGTCSAKRCGEVATRLGDGRPWCDDCYAEKFQGITPEVIGIRPR